MSKANQAFKQNDEAVSPVIGVILMVAITVVLAAVVFVLVSNLGKGSEKAPNVSFNKDSSAGHLTVVQADPGHTWAEFAFGGSCTTASTGSKDWTAPSSGDAVSAGTILGDCDPGETLSITHTATNSLVYSTTF
jgi:flagellin-like protein